MKKKRLFSIGLAAFMFCNSALFANAQDRVIDLQVDSNTESGYTATDASTEYAENVNQFVNEVEKVDDYCVYTNELTNTLGHEDGEVMIGKADVSTTVTIKGAGQGNQGEAYDNNVKSVVASAAEGVTIQFNDNNSSSNPTENFKTLEYGAGVTVKDTTNGCTYKPLTEEETKEVIEEIGTQLDTLAKEGQDIIVSNTYTAADGIKAIQSVATYLNETSDLDCTDTITITIPSSTLSDTSLTNDWNNNKILQQVINANKNNVQIVINVSTSADDAEIVIDRNMSNEVQQYGATNIIWNFGQYAGTIKGAQIVGTVIAGDATVSIGEVNSGSVAADKVGHSAEIHLCYDGKTVDPSDPSDPTDPTEPTDPENPDPENPDPENPDPENPDTPGTPDTPETPENPDTPSTPETPENPGTEDTTDGGTTTTTTTTTNTSTVTITDTAVPLAGDVEVLGASRDMDPSDVEVLGESRSPRTGQSFGIELVLIDTSVVLFAAMLSIGLIKKGKTNEKKTN